MFKNVATKVALFAFDTTTGAAKTGDAANLTAYVSIDYGSVTVLGDTSATEMDATNAKGWYLFDVAQAETNGDALLFTAKSTTANIAIVGQYVHTTPASFTSFVTPTGAAVNATQIGGQTASASGTVTFPNATIASTTNITAGTVTTATNVTTVNGLAAGVITAASIASDAITDAKVASDVTIASVTGSVGSVTGAVGSVTGAVGSVTGNVGGNVVGSVASVTARVTANTDQLAGQTVTAGAGVTFPASVASPTNITAGTITTVTNLTNAATAGDLTAAMISSVTTAATAATPTAAAVTGAVGSVTGNVGGNVVGTVASVAGAVGSVASGGIAAASFAAGAITAAAIATDAIDADALASDAVTEIQSGLATPASVAAIQAVTDKLNDTLQQDGGSPLRYQFTSAALELGPGGAGSDPWATLLPGSYGAGTAGKIVGDNLDAKISTRTKPADTQAAVTLVTTVSAVTGLTASDVGAIKAKTDNLPAAPSAVSDIPTAAQNADKLLGRTLAGSADGGRTVKDALRSLRNKTSITAGTLTVTEEDDTTPAWTATVTTAPGDPLTSIDPA